LSYEVKFESNSASATHLAVAVVFFIDLFTVSVATWFENLFDKLHLITLNILRLDTIIYNRLL